ncbi:M23 family metallopeptidase [Desmospora activa]|uniref:Peptidase M23-like protein n=1 Tax=Desmospora activa DSM 45169 TaxID=1121389 RepID=A0A2T4ZBS4_9BACL|nr:M23 family metallopeptidase [Desmospora activa]PTM59306.1 peptidase M23-like protein [Desmospora activa DSM 45169]
MGRPVVMVAAGLLLILLLVAVAHSVAPEVSGKSALVQDKTGQTIKPEKESLLVRKVEGRSYFHLQELKRLGIQIDVDEEMGTVTLNEGALTLHLVREAPVLSRNHRYLPVDATPLWEGENEIWIPVEVVEVGFDRSVKVDSVKGVATVGPPAAEASAFSDHSPDSPEEISVAQMIEYLSFLSSPIEGAQVSSQPSHLPGAPRTYRGGTHEGLDYYTAASGMVIDTDTAVIAAADGIIVRVDHDYVEMSEKQRNRLLEIAARHQGQTPAHIFDKMRGRTVWIQHKNGVLTRYAHLDRVSPNLQLGDEVKRGDRVGYVGNSGTRDGVKGNDRGLHLHFDILIDDRWIWEPYTPAERRQILEGVFN